MKKSLQALCIIGTALISLGCNQNASTPKSEIQKIETPSPSSATQNYKISEAKLNINIPTGYKLEKNTQEISRGGSFSNYNFLSEEKPSDDKPFLQEVRFYSKESITDFKKNCKEYIEKSGDELEKAASDEATCFYGEIPSIESFAAEKKAISEKTDYKDHKYLSFQGQPYLVQTSQCIGDSCFIRNYTTFFQDIEVDFYVFTYENKNSDKNDTKADELFSQIKINPY